MKMKTIETLIERESLKMLTNCIKDEKYIKENMAQLKQQERLYIERLEEIQEELKDERRKHAILEIQQYAAKKVLENKEYDTPLISNVIRKYDKVIIKTNLPDEGAVETRRDDPIGAIGVVTEIDEDYEYPYYVEFEDEDLNKQGWLWKREELEFAEGEW